jgi:hypothetical protein
MPYTRKVVVGTTVTTVLSQNEKRITIGIFNVGNYDAYIGIDQQNLRDIGFPVKAGGGIIFKKKDGDKVEYPLYAIADAQTELRVWEEFE